MNDHLFEDYQQRLDVLDENVRRLTLKYAEEFYLRGKSTKAEAIDRAIAKAEMEQRKL